MFINAIILAGGNSSRFGRFKQMEAVNAKQETLLEVNINTAIACGVRSFVIVSNLELKPFFTSLFSNWNDDVKCHLVVQSTDLLPKGTLYNPNRTKPWGVGHALWTAARELRGKFIMMNADDHYSPSTIQQLYDALVAERNPDQHYMAAYPLRNTLLAQCMNVNRGLCAKDGEYIRHIEVAHSISYLGDRIHGVFRQEEQDFSGDEITCMNLYGFNEGIISPLEDHVRSEIQNIADDTTEVTVHEMLNNLISHNRICLKPVIVDDWCLGLTNPEDSLFLQKYFAEKYGL
jgi:CTP:molybdopterin cytidylyltransferase MocA